MQLSEVQYEKALEILKPQVFALNFSIAQSSFWASVVPLIEKE